MAIYIMDLLPKPFESILKGEKDVEVRINYKNRDKIKPGDTLIFTKLPHNNISVKTEVIEVIKTKTFSELFDTVGGEHFRNKDKESFLESIYSIYTKEKENKYGVLGIKIKLLC